MPRNTPADFWAKVDKSGGPDACWPWTASLKPNGYGNTTWGNRTWNAHRLAYTLATAPIPDGAVIMHTCDVRACCNPAHLRAGTNADNSADMVAKGRQAKGETHPLVKHPDSRPRGERHGCAKLTEEQVKAARALVKDGHSLNSVARQFSVSRPSIKRLVVGETWRHVAA